MPKTYIARLTQELAVAKALGGSPVERTERAVATAATEPVVGTDTTKMLHFGDGEGTFDACVLYHTKEGHDDESARRICGRIQAEQDRKAGPPPPPPDPARKSGNEKIEKSMAFTRQIPLHKAGNKRELFGVIYPANRIDAQNEYTDEVELRKAAHLWLADSRVVNIEHTDEVASDVVPVESYLAPAGISEIDARKSDWCGRFTVKSDARWQEVEQGVYTGWSIEGVCDKQHEPNGVKKMVNLLVTKVSLVRNPANKLSFVAKGQLNKETKHMEPIKTTLEAIQKSAVALSKAVEAERVEFVPSFAPVKDEAEALAKSTNDQAQYVLGVLVSVEKAVAVRNEVLAKSAEVIDEQQNTIRELSATVEALRSAPDVMEAEKLAGAINGDGAK